MMGPMMDSMMSDPDMQQQMMNSMLNNQGNKKDLSHTMKLSED